MAMPTLQDYQYQFKDNGVLLNGDDMPMWDVQKVQGLDLPTKTMHTSDYDGAHGASNTAKYFDSRMIIVEGTLYSDPEDVDVAVRNLGATMLSDVADKFWFKKAGIATSYVLAKPLALKCDTDTARRVGSAPFQLQFVADDPRMYRDITVPNIINGSTFSLNNLGHVDSFPVITIADATNDITVAVPFVGTVTFETLEAFDGDVIVIDLGKRILTRNGINMTSAYTGGSWPYLRPGTSNWTITATSNPDMSVTARSAWML